MNHLRTFYILTITQLFSLIGSRMSNIAVGIYIFDKTGNTAPLLIAAFFAEIPGMVGGTFTGILADRWDRRHVMILGDAGQAVGTLLLLTSFLSGSFELWHLYLASLMQGIFGIIQAPASEATTAMLVPEEHRDRANGIQQIGFPLAGVIAPMVAGLIYSFVGVEGVMIADLLTFLVAVTIVFLIHIPRPEKSEEGSGENFLQEMLGGWRFLITRRSLLGLVVYISFINFLLNGPLGIAIPYIVTVTGDEKSLGWLLAAMNLGAFAGALSIAIIGSIPNRVRVIFLGYFLVSALFCVYGIVRSPLLIGITLFALFFPLPLTNALMASIIQNKTPADVQGRVFAVTGQMFMLATPFSFLITGALVDNILEPAVGKAGWGRVSSLVGNDAGAGMGLLLIGVGVVIFISTLAVYLIPSIRHLEKDLPDYKVLVQEETHLSTEQLGLV